MINFIKIRLQFGSFKIHFMKIQLSFMILRKNAEIVELQKLLISQCMYKKWSP